MTLKNWHDNGWLKPHKTSRQEIQGLIAMVHRDLSDARQKEVSADWRFGIAYNASLKLCTIQNSPVPFTGLFAFIYA
jgi:hypothetical protein